MHALVIIDINCLKKRWPSMRICIHACMHGVTCDSGPCPEPLAVQYPEGTRTLRTGPDVDGTVMLGTYLGLLGPGGGPWAARRARGPAAAPRLCI